MCDTKHEASYGWIGQMECVVCGHKQGTTKEHVQIQEQRRERLLSEEAERERYAESQRSKLLVAKMDFVKSMTEQLLKVDPELRKKKMELHKMQHQAADLGAARTNLKARRKAAAEEAERRKYEEDLYQQEQLNKMRDMAWLADLVTISPDLHEKFDSGELNVTMMKEMSNVELRLLGLSAAEAENVLKAVAKETREAAIAAGEFVEELEEEKKEPDAAELEQAELERKAEEQKKKEEEEAAAAAANRAEIEQAVKLREDKQKIREIKQAEKREANKARQAKLALEKKKKEELRVAKLKEKAEAAKLEARRKEEEAYEAERVANRAKMEAFLAAERESREVVEVNESKQESVHDAEEDRDEEYIEPPPLLLSSGRLLADLSMNAFLDTDGELRMGLVALSTSCATVYGKRSKIIRRELTWLLKSIIKVYGENIIVTTPLADEMEILGAEIVLSLGLQLRALLPVKGPSQENNNDAQLRTFDVSAAVAAAIGPDLSDIHPEYHASIAQRRVRLTELLSKDNVIVYHVPSLEWETHGYHCIRGILSESSDMMLAVVDAVPSPSPPGLLWDSVRTAIMKKIPMVVVKSHESGADVHGFRNTDVLGRTLLARYTADRKSVV